MLNFPDGQDRRAVAAGLPAAAAARAPAEVQHRLARLWLALAYPLTVLTN